MGNSGGSLQYGWLRNIITSSNNMGTTTTTASPSGNGALGGARMSQREGVCSLDHESEIHRLRVTLERRDREIEQLRSEIHKLKSVLQATVSNGRQDPLASLHQSTQSSTPQKKQGVSGESAAVRLIDIPLPHHAKDLRSKQTIKEAIMENDFLQHLDASQVFEIVECMYPQVYPENTVIIQEGDIGSHLYVAADGELAVEKESRNLGRIGPGKVFGELAILYNCTRTATVRAVSRSELWVLDRRLFQIIMMKTGLQRQEERINFLKSVPLLRSLSNDVLSKMADVLEVEFFPSNVCIVRQGTPGDTFFIISHGSVHITKTRSGTEELIRTLSKGDYFGEQALLNEEKRTASVIAADPGVECLVLDRDSFIQLIGDLREWNNKQYDDHPAIESDESIIDEDPFYQNLTLEDLNVITTLGVGGFGKVHLVQHRRERSRTFALKCLTKQRIVDTHQEQHVLSEKRIMAGCRHPFICRLYRTFKDNQFVYMLMEVCLGGEVWSLLRDRGAFDETTTRFYTACVVEALDYLHSHSIIYRDLKPENLVLDTRGYAKLCDFGFSKRLLGSEKTWTFCGTPEYVAPEIILNKGHDHAVDFWALGIFIYELLVGMPPFVAEDPMKTYNVILKGIDMVEFPRSLSRNAVLLIKRFCRDNPSERIGYQLGGINDIRKHKWFQGFDWTSLSKRTLEPPFEPIVDGPTDSSNFDVYPRLLDDPPVELSGWDQRCQPGHYAVHLDIIGVS